MCPEGGSPTSFLVLNFTQILSTVLTGSLFLLALSHVIYQQQHPPGGGPKHPLDLLMLVQFLVCAFGAFWVIFGVALPWGDALNNWYFPAHNALANSVAHGCSLNSFIAKNNAMNRAYDQASQMQGALTRSAAIAGAVSFALLALYARVVRGRWSWMSQFFANTPSGVQNQDS